MIYGWSPGIGDPTALGWITVVAYFAAAILCFRSAQTLETARDLPGEIVTSVRLRRRFWWLSAALLLALGINKQLDLQTLMTDMGRSLARHEGWYETRRIVQAVFIALVGLGTITVIVVAVHRLRRAGIYILAAVTGEALLCAFVFIRAASFHHGDALLAASISGVRMNHLMELGGILIISGAAIGAGRRRTQDPTAPAR